MRTTRPIIPKPATGFTTSRLYCRPMRTEDLNDFHSLRTIHEVMKWTSTTQIDEDVEFTKTWMERFLPPNDATTFNMAVEELERPGKIVGVVGVFRTTPPELGYMLRPELWGKGVATEAVRGLLQAYWSLPRQEIEIEPDNDSGDGGKDVVVLTEILKAVIDGTNTGSRKVLERCGFKHVSSEQMEEHGRTVPLEIYELEKPLST